MTVQNLELDYFADMNFEIPELPEDEKPCAKIKPVYTADIETDPFLYGRAVKPFCTGFYDGVTFQSTWGPDCIEQMIEQFYEAEPGIIYFHNGGRFDFFFFLKEFAGFPSTIINGRIVKAKMKCRNGVHELRDSYAIMPFALATYKKTEIDYTKFEADVRELHKSEILAYQKDDCVDLWELCNAFVDMFGPKLTIGGTAMKELQKLHSFENLGPVTDNGIRSLYYYGGRVECFKVGVIEGDYKVYDVNSMYPFAMRDYLHPIGLPYGDSTTIRSTTCFLTVEGKNHGAFPTRTKTGLRFDIEDGIFHVSIHEWETAIRNNLFEPRRIIRCVNFRDRITFEKFVSTFYNLRHDAKNCGDHIHALFYKYILNSAYGKFAQNPENYFDYQITLGHEFMDAPWMPETIYDSMGNSPTGYIVWKKPSKLTTRYNVATAASITGASRSILLDAIANSVNPIYCDTDSLICESLNVKIHDSDLGAWKLETEAHKVCIAGKKLYAIFSLHCPSCKNIMTHKSNCKHSFHLDGCSKQANKGVRITAKEIEAVCNGATVTSRRDAPSYKLDGSHNFITRNIKMRNGDIQI